MTVGDLISRLEKLPADMELWEVATFPICFPVNGVDVERKPIYENHWNDETPSWELVNEGAISRKAKMVALIKHY